MTSTNPGKSKVRFVGGDKTMIAVPRAEWEALQERIEDLEDALVVERFRREHGAGTEAFIPAEVANRIIDGETPLKVWRTYRGLTQESLAAAATVADHLPGAVGPFAPRPQSPGVRQRAQSRHRWPT